MFNMGGPIKQGVMNGIREPKRDGGKMLLVGQHPKEFRDKSGREKHIFPLVGIGAAIARFAPAAYRGYKAARYFQPGKLGKWGRFKSMFGVGKGLGAPMAQSGAGAGFRVGSFPKQNPLLAFTAASAVPQVGYAGYKAAKAAPGTVWGATKRYADMVIPGDQSRWWKDKEPPTGVPLNPNLQKLIAAADVKETKEEKKLSEAERKAFANKQREERVNKYLDMMGYDRSKKMAIADALIDASKIVGERGTLDPKNITRDLISPIIQATSKRLDKPAQIREAVGLMATKAEIEKDLSAETDALAKKLTTKRIEALDKQLEEGFEVDMRNLLLTSRTAPDKKTLERYARLTADKYSLDFTKVTDEMMAKAPEGASEEEVIQSVVTGDGIYQIGNAIIKVTGGVPKVLI
jgi:hypothetical protein